jgi:hypothetical protein
MRNGNYLTMKVRMTKSMMSGKPVSWNSVAPFIIFLTVLFLTVGRSWKKTTQSLLKKLR